jgi:hypothetical protein
MTEMKMSPPEPPPQEGTKPLLVEDVIILDSNHMADDNIRQEQESATDERNRFLLLPLLRTADGGRRTVGWLGAPTPKTAE